MFNRQHAGGLLTIDLHAIRSNWQFLSSRLSSSSICAAVVKADAYGLGAIKVAPALAKAGCKHFFVAHIHEAFLLKPHLPIDAFLYVLHGPPPGTEKDMADNGLIPVLNTLSQVYGWASLARVTNKSLPAILQFDTGMSRLGLSLEEINVLADDPSKLQGIDVRYTMSHLTAAELQEHPSNEAQLTLFNQLRSKIQNAPATLANSSGVFLGSNYHFDLVRPGAALYGVAPVIGMVNPMKQVIRLQARVIQTRHIEIGTGVGYGSTWKASSPTNIATLSVGYADGYFRALSNHSVAYFNGIPLKLIGNVSMDTMIIDIGNLPDNAIGPGDMVDLINENHTIDDVANNAKTIAYEVLTNLGSRYYREYIGD